MIRPPKVPRAVRPQEHGAASPVHPGRRIPPTPPEATDNALRTNVRRLLRTNAIRHGLGPLSARDGLIALMILLPCVGAAIGAALHPSSGLRYGGEAAIALTPDADSGQLSRHAGAVKLSQVISGARAAAHSTRSVSNIADHTTVVVEPRLRLVLVRVRAEDPAKALALANALADGAMSFIRSTLVSSPDGSRTLGDFEDASTEQWGVVRSAFNHRPLKLRPVQGSAHRGSGKLRVTCPRGPSCGPSVRVYGSFREGATYSVQGWVRSLVTRVRVSLVLGVSSTDLGVSRARGLSPGWRRLKAFWTPKADAAWTEVAFQTQTTPRGASFDIDRVSLFDPLAVGMQQVAGRRAAATSGRGSRPSQEAPSASIVPAVPVVQNRENPMLAALVGGLGGLVMATAAVGLAQLARRRRAAALA